MGIFTKAWGILFILSSLAVCNAASAQSDPFSLSSTVPSQWVLVDQGVSPGNVSVTIRKGDTISLDTTGYCSKLIIESGATLNSTGNAANGTVYNLLAGGGTTPSPDTIQNDGTFGSVNGANDGIMLAIPSTCNHLTLLGDGVTAIGGIRPAAYNTRLTFKLAQNASLSYKGVAFSAFPIADSAAAADNITFIIDTNKTLKLLNAGSQWHGVSANGIGGNYTYNINGTLDIAATDTSSVAPFKASASSVITTNINGRLILGEALMAETPSGGTPGKAVFNIADGALVDATATQTLNTGTNFFATSGSGTLKRKVDNNNVSFPVGSASYSPVILNNSGTVTNFSVSVKDQIDNADMDYSNKEVNKQWTLTPDNAQGANITVIPGWLSGDQVAGFKTNASIAVLHYDGSNWNEAPANLGGLGTLTAPYTATASGFTTFGNFVVANSKINTEVVNLNIYPNPVSSMLNVTFPATGSDARLTIVTVDGRKVISTGLGSGVAEWNTDVSNWASGVYVFTIYNGAKHSSAKFIKL